MNLFLRWMVRRTPPDLGIWAFVDPAKLVMPVDTHIHRIATFLGLNNRKSADWKAARALTDRLAKFDRADPVRYDFAICRLGILDLCSRKTKEGKLRRLSAARCLPVSGGVCLGREHLAERGKDFALCRGWNSADASDEAHAIDSPQLIENDLSLFAPNLHWMRLGYGCPLVVIGATMTVWMWRFNSSGETMTQGRVFRISLPMVGSRLTR